MIEKLNKDEEELIESLFDPICLIECLFSDLDNNNLAAFDENKFSEVRLGQKSMVSYEYCLDYDNMKLTTKQKFKQREGSGNVFCFGARRFGKTLITESLDLILDLILMEGDNVGFSSYDAIHIEGVLEGVIQAFENHPFLRMFDARVKRNPYLIALRKNGSRVIGVNMNLCVDEQTEILTDNGWRNIDTIDKNDKALSLNLKTNIADYYNIENIYKNNYNGDVYEMKGFSNFVFTPEHKILYNWTFIQPWKLKAIQEFNNKANSQILLKDSFIWNREDRVEPIVFNIRKNNRFFEKKEIDFDLWLEFLGWYVSEGHISEENLVFITQYKSANPEKCLIIENILRRMGVNFCFVKDKQYKIYCADIAKHLRENCYEGNYIRVKTIYNSHTKKVPSYIKNLSSRQIGLFLKHYKLGDANCTISKQLADDVMELMLKNGKRISCSQGKDGTYYINELTAQFRNVPLKNIIKRDYNGRVWCIETNPHHLIFIRRNGKCCWTGNSGENPGGQFFQKHFSKLYIEEASQEVQEVYEKRLDSVSENGCVFRISGMTDFIKYSPPGKIYYEQNNQPWVVNYPQFVNPKWDEKEKEKAIKEHSGESSVSYRMYVKGEIVEDRNSAIDMERVRANYNENKIIKNFEITKENLFDFQNIIIIERPKNAEVIYIAADIGEVASSEIIIISKVNETYHYLYNITLYNITDKEQFNIFKYIIWQMEANYIALDTTDGTGRSIYRSLEEIFPKESLVWCGFNEKIQIDVLRDDNGNILMKDGNILYKEEMVAAWSVKRLKDLLYEKGKVNLPIDHKLDTQLNSVISIQSGNKTLYECISKSNGDHLFAAWRVFAIAEWKNYMTNTNSIKRKTFSKIGC